MTEAATGVYLDTNALVYAVQAGSDMAAPMLHFLAKMERAHRKPVTSELTLAELLCKRDLTSELHAIYVDLLIESDAIQLEPVTRDILLTSAEMRRSGGALKLQDALHVATAISARCQFMLTNDAGIRTPPEGLTVLRPTQENVTHNLRALHV
jgi:predicted nucleic acid-binding protein